MEEEEDMSPLFWLQSGQDDHRLRRTLRRSYSIFLTSSAFVMVLLVIALVFIFVIIPTLLSFTSHIFKPQLVKRSWDFLNLVLVLFAIVCGFLSRNTNESTSSYEDQNFSSNETSEEYTKSNPRTPRPWYEYSDRNAYNSYNRLRSISSYPDLRLESSWVSAAGGGDNRWRFCDDTRVARNPEVDVDEHRKIRHRRSRTEVDGNELRIKNIEVDTFVVRAREVLSAPLQPEARPASQTPSPPSSPPQTPPARRKSKRRYQAIERVQRIERQGNNGFEIENFQPPPSTPPSPPLLPPVFQRKNDQNKKKRASATKEFLTSLRGKKKKHRQKSVENFESILDSEPSQPPSSAPPPPPPPPPPPSVFHNLFSKKSKHKKIHSAPPPPPPPPPRISPTRVSKSKPSIGGVIMHKSQISNKIENFNRLEEVHVVTRNESPLIPIPPPPPPPPPFKMPVWKFRVQGDYVRVDSISSRSSSPDLDDVEDSPRNEDGGVDSATATPLFCPSPDVDTKADTFIARFRAGLRLEKMNSMNEKQGIGKSNLGPSLNPSPESRGVSS